MITKLVYLDDFDVTTTTANVTGIEQQEDGRADVQLDQTCFYPRGGGQDWDTGSITSVDGSSATFDVDEVRLSEDGIVHHLGTYVAGKFEINDAVTCTVDKTRRDINTRLHSAGHVVDLAVDALKLRWVPAKGAHYPHMSFVEYEGEANPDQLEELRQKLEQTVTDFIAKGSKNEIRYMPVSEMHTVCRHVPANIPAHKPARVVIYNGDFGVPCGGTHVADIHDIGQVGITKIKSKKGVTKVSYAVQGIN